MQVLVTGGSGYLGSHIRHYFDADDLSRRSNLDLLDMQDVHLASEYDVVIHFAAHLDKSPDAADEVFLVNVQGTINLLRAMRPGSTIIFASTKDVYGRFADKYAEVPEECPTVYAGQTSLEWSKLIAERYIEYYAHQKNMRSCIMRMSTIYAPPSDGNAPSFPGAFAERMIEGRPIKLPGGGLPVRDILHVDDLAKACHAFIDSVINHGLYNIGGGRENSLSLGELIPAMEKASGLQAVVEENGDPSMPAPKNYITDLSLIKQELDWKPEIGIEKGLASLFQRGIVQE